MKDSAMGSGYSGERIYGGAGDVAARIGVSRATVYRAVKRGVLPQPVYVLGRSVWSFAAVDEAIAQLAKPTT